MSKRLKEDFGLLGVSLVLGLLVGYYLGCFEAKPTVPPKVTMGEDNGGVVVIVMDGTEYRSKTSGRRDWWKKTSAGYERMGMGPSVWTNGGDLAGIYDAAFAERDLGGVR